MEVDQAGNYCATRHTPTSRKNTMASLPAVTSESTVA